MKKFIAMLIIGAICATLCFSLVSCQDGEEESETGHKIIVENDGDWDIDGEIYSGNGDNGQWELGGIPLG